jgi:hypothetical protein
MPPAGGEPLMSGNLRVFKLKLMLFSMASGPPRPPEEGVDGALPQTSLKGTSTLENPIASRYAPALNIYNQIDAD